MDSPRCYRLGRFDVHGMPLHVEAEEPVLFEAVDRILGPFSARQAQREEFVLRVCRRTAAAALYDDLPCLWQGMLPSGYAARYMADQSRRRLELVGAAVAELDLSTRRAQITLLSQDDRCIAGGCLTPLLTEMLRTTGWHLIHAACLRAGAGTSARAVLLCGQSGLGKTTTALALSRGPLRLLGDDAAFIRGDGKDPLVFGLPRPCKVHPHTAELLGWLPAMIAGARTVGDEFILDFARVGEPTPQAVVPAAVLIMGPRNLAGHELRPVDKLSAVAELARQNVRHLGGGAPFAAVAALAACCGCYALSVGPDLNGLGRAILSLPELSDAAAC